MATIGAIIGAIILFIILIKAMTPSSSRYPDGNCYMCRRGPIDDNEVCKNCGTEQLL